jgi:hypothetical protein
LTPDLFGNGIGKSAHFIGSTGLTGAIESSGLGGLLCGLVGSLFLFLLLFLGPAFGKFFF